MAALRRCAAEGVVRKDGSAVPWKAWFVQDSPNLLDFEVTLPGRRVTQTVMSSAHQAPMVATRIVREAA